MSAPALEVAALSLRYQLKKQSDPVLDEVSFEVSRGEVLAVIGPNGSGKSSLLKFVSGVLPIDAWHVRKHWSGHVRVHGSDLLSLVPAARARQVLYLGSHLQCDFPLTVREFVELGNRAGVGSAGGALSVDAALAECDAGSLARREIRTLSGGERQRVALARAYAQGARILIVDEAFSQMDLHHLERIRAQMRALAQRGWAIVLVTHQIERLGDWADRGLLLASGRVLAQGPVREIISPQSLARAYPALSPTSVL